ncbi:MAG: 23S rRNA (pseudouridine(1915)-N(3))-methyltransferase RlmH [Caulobacteraceae bacterium]
MRISILAIGRLARGPERDLVSDYVTRATAAGRVLGLGPVEVVEIEPRKSGKPAEGEALLAALEGGDVHLIACDEHGQPWASRDMAARVGRWRDGGTRRLAFVIGGADGLSADVLSRAETKLAFGPQTWPHALARVMLAEQVYRAVTILAGSPYHRD